MVREESLQRFGKIRVTLQQIFFVRFLTGFDGIQIIGNDFIKPIIARRIGSRHQFASCSSVSRSVANARRSKPATEERVRSSCSAISGMVMPCR